MQRRRWRDLIQFDVFFAKKSQEPLLKLAIFFFALEIQPTISSLSLSLCCRSLNREEREEKEAKAAEEIENSNLSISINSNRFLLFLHQQSSLIEFVWALRSLKLFLFLLAEDFLSSKFCLNGGFLGLISIFVEFFAVWIRVFRIGSWNWFLKNNF